MLGIFLIMLDGWFDLASTYSGRYLAYGKAGRRLISAVTLNSCSLNILYSLISFLSDWSAWRDWPSAFIKDK